MHIMKSKIEPATNRIKRLLEILCSYSFNLYDIKGKDMVLSDFLSRQLGDDSDPYQIIPISFNIKEILKENYHNMVKDMYMVQTRSQAKAKANAPTAQNTTGRPVTQNAIPKIDKIPIKTEKDSKPLQSTVVGQQLPQGLVIPPGNIIPINTQPSVRPPQNLQMLSIKKQLQAQIEDRIQMCILKRIHHIKRELLWKTYVTPNQSYLE